MNDHNLIQYAFNKQGQRISVYDVPFGNKTSCFCRICGQPLGAKNKGKTRDTILEPYQKSAHFYHLNNSQCHGETLIHIIAKEVLKKLRKIKFLIEVRNHNDELLEFKTSEKELHEIESEYKIQVSEDKKVRPDIKAIIENKPLFIEFAYSSYIDYEKKYFIKKSRLNVIEIELNVPYINWNDFKSEEELEKKNDRIPRTPHYQ